MAFNGISALIGGKAMNWGFSCGRIAIWEKELSPYPFFQGLLRAASPERCRQEMAKSPFYRSLAGEPADFAALPEAAKKLFARRREKLLSGCPDHPLKDYCRFPELYRSFRSEFTRFMAQETPRGAEVEAFLERLLPGPRYAGRLREHRAMIYRAESPQTSGAPERSIYLDSLACSFMDLFAQDSPEPLVKRFIHDSAALAAWSAIIRARRNRTPIDRLLYWFVFGPDRRLVIAVLRDEAKAAAAIRPFLSGETGRALAAQTPERIAENIDAAADEALRPLVLQCRKVLSGAERVLAYLEALRMEEANITLCLIAMADSLDPEAAERRLRRVYA